MTSVIVMGTGYPITKNTWMAQIQRIQGITKTAMEMAFLTKWSVRKEATRIQPRLSKTPMAMGSRTWGSWVTNSILKPGFTFQVARASFVATAG